MVRPSAMIVSKPMCSPRASGDDPVMRSHPFRALSFSPHERGGSACSRGSEITEYLLRYSERGFYNAPDAPWDFTTNPSGERVSVETVCLLVDPCSIKPVSRQSCQIFLHRRFG